jgi:hypothetical protein
MQNSMKNLSILRNQSKYDVKKLPFPHIIIENAIPSDLAQRLTNDFPVNLFLDNENNKRLDISVCNLDKYESISQQWKDFILYHSSSDFLFEFIDIFQDHIKNSSSHKALSLNDHHIGRRNIDSFTKCEVLLDAQISLNTPVLKESSVRKIHVDSENKIYSGLFYLRQPQDDSLGGDLNLYSWKSNYTSAKKLKFYKEGVEEKHLELHKTIKYKNNVAILFLNSLDALHGITPREATSHPRTFVNLVAESSFEIYKKHRLHKKFLIASRKKLSEIKKIFF